MTEWTHPVPKCCPVCSCSTLNGPHNPASGKPGQKLYECMGLGCNTHFILCGTTPVEAIDFSKIPAEENEGP